MISTRRVSAVWGAVLGVCQGCLGNSPPLERPIRHRSPKIQQTKTKRLRLRSWDLLVCGKRYRLERVLSVSFLEGLRHHYCLQLTRVFIWHGLLHDDFTRCVVCLVGHIWNRGQYVRYLLRTINSESQQSWRSTWGLLQYQVKNLARIIANFLQWQGFNIFLSILGSFWLLFLLVDISRYISTMKEYWEKGKSPPEIEFVKNDDGELLIRFSH